MKYAFLFLSLFVSLGCFAQIPVKLNDTLWTIQTVTIFESGDREVKQSKPVDSASVIKQYQRIVENQYYTALARNEEKKFFQMDSILLKLTGQNYESTMKYNVQAEIQGGWKIKAPDTTYTVLIDKLIVKDSTRNAIGSVEINNRLSITINGVTAKPLVFNATSKDGIVAIQDKKQYFLIKS